MIKYLTTEFVDTSEYLKDEINQQLTALSAPNIALSNDEYERTEAFVQFNDWLKEAKRDEVSTLAKDFGLLPIIYALSGVNVIQATLMQETSKIDVLGVITYIRMALMYTVGDDMNHLHQLGETLFSDTYQRTDEIDTRSLFISLLISKCINTRDDITYEQSVARLIEPVLVA